MTKIEDFENAPVGATATRKMTGGRAMKIDDIERRWVHLSGIYLNDEEMGDFTLDRPAPTTAREALDLAWELAHPVKEGQVIPEDTRFIQDANDGIVEYTAEFDIKVTPNFEPIIRTFEPLPEPEPDWLDAPAVLATCGCRGIELWHPHESKDGLWVSSARGEHALWSSLRDVTPLYPKEDA